MFSNGTMVLNTREILSIIILMEKGFTFGTMIEHIKVNGRTIRCMEEESSCGKMGESILESTLKIRYFLPNDLLEIRLW